MKNKIGGKKTKSMSSKHNEIIVPFISKTNDTEYGKVISVLGGKNIQIKLLENNNTIIGILRGNMRKRVWLVCDDIVLVSKREYSDKFVDIIHKYPNEHVNKLYRLGEIVKDKNDINNDIVFTEEIPQNLNNIPDLDLDLDNI